MLTMRIYPGLTGALCKGMSPEAQRLRPANGIASPPHATGIFVNVALALGSYQRPALCPWPSILSRTTIGPCHGEVSAVRP